MALPTLNVTPKAIRWFNTLLGRLKADEIISEVVTVTPDIAAVILSRNPGNRKIRDAKLIQYTRDIVDGNFQLNGVPIIITREGILNDGQHRLYAVVNAKRPIQAILTIGVERETRATVDTGASRSAGDHLGLEGFSNANTAASVARYILTLREDGIYQRKGSISQTQQINLVRTDAMLREIAGWVDSSKNRTTSMMKGSLLGFIHYLLSEKAPVEARAFMDSLRTGANLHAESPIYLARERLRNTKMTDVQKVELVFRAWNHWCESPMTRLSRMQIMNRMPELETPRGFMSLPLAQPQSAEAIPA